MATRKVKCIDNLHVHDSLKMDAVYEVLNEDPEFYHIVDESGRLGGWCKYRFEAVDDIIEEKPATTTQIGGDHYRTMKIQPIEYVMANQIAFPEGNVIKYVSRWRKKNGIEDLKKARHMLDTIIEAVEKGTY